MPPAFQNLTPQQLRIAQLLSIILTTEQVHPQFHLGLATMDTSSSNANQFARNSQQQQQQQQRQHDYNPLSSSYFTSVAESTASSPQLQQGLPPLARGGEPRHVSQDEQQQLQRLMGENQILAMQRQEQALEMNQRILTALYAKQVQDQMLGDQKTSRDLNLLRHYGIPDSYQTNQQQQQQQQFSSLPNQQAGVGRMLPQGIYQQSSLPNQQATVSMHHQQLPQTVPYQQSSSLQNQQAAVSMHQQLPQTVPYQQSPLLQNRMHQQLPRTVPYQQATQQQIQYSLESQLRRQAIEDAFSKCNQLLAWYVREQRQPKENSFLFWKTLFQTFFAEKATERWCLSCYNSTPAGDHAKYLFPADNWRCNLCAAQPSRGFDVHVDMLPRLSKIKHDSGLIEELFYLELPDEKSILPSGFLVLEYFKAVQKSSYPEVVIIKQGRLRVTFNSFFKICVWEFCPRSHEEGVTRSHLRERAYSLATVIRQVEEEGTDTSIQNLKQQCHELNQAAKQISLRPSVNDLGLSKRYVRCVQILEVVQEMEELMKFSKRTGLGPIESLSNFPNPRKRQHLEDSSPQSSTITYLSTQPENPSSMHKIPFSAVFSQPQPEFRAQLQQPSSRQRLQQQQQQLRARSAHSNQTGQQSLPGTPQSDMSDLRSSS